MKIILLFIALLIFSNHKLSFAQEPPKITSTAIKNLVAAADSCARNGDTSCSKFYKAAVELGAKQGVSYLFYLEFKLGENYTQGGQWDSALRYINRALQHTNAQAEQEFLLNLKSFLFYNKGEPDSAIFYMIKVSKMLERRKDTAKLAYTYLNLGNAFYAQENREQSIRYLEKSYHLLKAIKDTVNIVNAAGNIADGYLSVYDTLKAIKWCYATLGLKEYAKDREGKIIAFKTLAKIKSATDADSAAFLMKMGIDMAKELNDKLQLGNLYALYAQVLESKGEAALAQKYVDEAIAQHRAIGFVPGLANNLTIAGEVSLSNGNFKKAAQYFHEAQQINDSLKSERRVSIINELSTKYETEKKENLLAQQALKIQQNKWWMSLAVGTIFLLILLGVLYQKIRNAKLQKVMREKENAILKAQMIGEERERNRISKNLHDGVAAMLSAAKMNVQAIPFLSKEQQTEQLVKVSKILEDTHADIRRIAHDLLPITLQKEGLLAAIIQFADDVSQTGILKISVVHSLSNSVLLDKQAALMLFRIVQELVNNIIKHSQATEAGINLYEDGSHMNIVVEDNGQGFIESREYQGLYSIKERLSAIGGNFAIGNNATKGTRASLSINLDKMVKK